MIDLIPNYGPVNSIRKALWRTLNAVRNDLFHHDKLPGPRESQLLIEEVDKLESDIDAGVFQTSPFKRENPRLESAGGHF